MRTVLITGSRSIKTKEYVFYILDKEIKEGDYIIQGGAEGVDKLVLDWCNSNNRKDGVNWDTIEPINKKDKSYYLHRNAEMIGMCDIVIAIWDGKSRGTDFTIRYAKERFKPVILYNTNDALVEQSEPEEKNGK